jgi:hypothetical protein
MARRTKDVTITSEGRDKGKVFRITELPAKQGEDFAIRIFNGMARSGITVPDEIRTMGLAGLASIAFRSLAGMKYEDLQPLMDEMLHCVQIVPNPSKPIPRALMGEDDVEEIPTFFTLRKEVFELHTGFSLADKIQTLVKSADPAASNTLNTSTSPEQSA